MRRIISTDTCRFNHGAEKVFYAVADVTGYKNWWSKNVKVLVLESNVNFIGSKVEVSASGGRFRCEIVSVKKPFEVRVRYYAGVQKGEGNWTIIPESDSVTGLTYSIDLEPNGFIPRFLSNFINYSKIHSNAMKEMFTGLDKYLS
ncbi:MAG: SRPBCC family protein [Ignavibacteria bacterium]|jgi:ribosome-associated toxin RatA of RatAB toxin-antitoxin module|nr:SRPBCC family protein [Ignavibacteria bacterium]